MMVLLAAYLAVIRGMGWVVFHVAPWVYIGFWICLPITALLSGAMCLFKQARPAAGTILITASYVFGIALWVTGFIETFVYWGWTGIIIGLFFFGVGVAPVGFIAALFHADWPTVAFLVMACLATFGARILGLKLIETATQPLEPAW